MEYVKQGSCERRGAGIVDTPDGTRMIEGVSQDTAADGRISE